MQNIMIVGVGGQGTLLASRILGNVAIQAGYDVKVSEVHGMSQRGGSVVTYVKYGEKVHSPIIDKGEADIILASAFGNSSAYYGNRRNNVCRTGSGFDSSSSFRCADIQGVFG